MTLAVSLRREGGIDFGAPIDEENAEENEAMYSRWLSIGNAKQLILTTRDGAFHSFTLVARPSPQPSAPLPLKAARLSCRDLPVLLWFGPSVPPVVTRFLSISIPKLSNMTGKVLTKR